MLTEVPGVDPNATVSPLEKLEPVTVTVTPEPRPAVGLIDDTVGAEKENKSAADVEDVPPLEVVTAIATEPLTPEGATALRLVVEWTVYEVAALDPK